MKDIADMLAFLGLDVLDREFGIEFEEKREIRRRFCEVFTELLENLPENTIPEQGEGLPDYVTVTPIKPEAANGNSLFHVTFEDWPKRHYCAKTSEDVAALIAKYEAGEIKE